jgi:hypothetical protein
MRQLLTTFIIVAVTITAHTQEAKKSDEAFVHKNTVQIELFGHGLLYSLNYERVIFNGNRFKTTGQIGLAYYPPKTNLIEVWIPVMLNQLLSFDKHHIELGLGHVFVNEHVPGFDTATERRRTGGFISGRLGYRFQKPDGRLIIRAGFTPFREYRGTNAFHPSGGLAVGYSL